MVTARSRSQDRVDSSSSASNASPSHPTPANPRNSAFNDEPSLAKDDPTYLKIEVVAPGAPPLLLLPQRADSELHRPLEHDVFRHLVPGLGILNLAIFIAQILLGDRA